MNIWGRTDTGRVRENNQDAFLCGRLSERALFAVVCDGMGGANGGNVASSLAVRVVSNRIMETYREDLPEKSLRSLLESAVAAANIEVFDAAMEDPGLRGMGTTAVVVIAVERKAYITHVGDSRAYLLRPGGMEQITRDHSIVQAMVEKGQLTQDEARNHPRKHFITRALGVEDTVVCDYSETALEEKERLLLCTDGLTNMLEPDEIDRLAQSTGSAELPDRLIHEANMAGGSDNITVVLIA